MQKPDSMKKFDLLYLGSLAVGLIGLALGWDGFIEQLNAEFAAQDGATENLPPSSAIIVGVFFGYAISLGLWFLVSVMRVEFVKWILILLTGFGLVMMLSDFTSGNFGMIELSSVLSTLMSIAALIMLFRDDSKEWFAAKKGAE